MKYLKKFKEYIFEIKKHIKIVGNILTIIAIIFIIKRVIAMDINYFEIFRFDNLLYLILVLMLNTAAVFIAGSAWGLVVEIIVDKKIYKRNAVVIHAKANILKYVPGNVFQYIGRNSLALQINTEHTNVAFATIVDIFCTVFSCIFVSAIFMGKSIFNYLILYIDKIIFITVIVSFIIICLIIFIIYKFKSKIYSFFISHLKIIHKKNILKFLCILMIYIFNNVLSVFVYLLILKLFLNYRFDLYSFSNVVGAFNLAWLIGFIIPGSPGGIGVRESMMTIIAGELLNNDIIVISMVIYRFVNILADIVSYLIAVFVTKIKSINDREIDL